MQVGVLGGTGPAGRGLAVRAASAGHVVHIGSREAARAAAIATELRGDAALAVSGVTNEDAANAELVVVATPWDAVVATVRPLAAALDGKVVISMVNALVRQGREMVALVPPRGSMAAELQAALPGSSVTAALHHLPASLMEDLASDLVADVLVCGDDAGARGTTCEFIDTIKGLRAVEVGSLAQAGPIESFTAACITVNIRHKVHSTLRLGGL
jgi:8-hydroxy-5-deazaflavin:NADPH oxidoreductase